MLTLNQLRIAAQEFFPGEKLKVSHLLYTWAKGDNSSELSSLLLNSGINILEFMNVLFPFTQEEEDGGERGLMLNAISSVSGESPRALHLLKSMLIIPYFIITKRLVNAGIDVQVVLKNIERTLENKAVLARSGIVITEQSQLLKYGRDLTALAKEGAFDGLCQRTYEVTMLMDVLLRSRKPNPVITGPAGVGKTALVELLAREVVMNTECPLYGYKIYEISMGKMVSGTKYRGEFEERFEEVERALLKSSTVIAFIDEIHLISRAGAAEGGAMDAANLLKPVLARGDIRIIGATTSEEFQIIAKDEALERRFQEIRIEEPDRETLLQMLETQLAVLKKHHRVDIEPDVVAYAVELSDRYLKNRSQPDKSLDLLDTTAVAVRRRGERIMGRADLRETTSRLTGVPIGISGSCDRQVLKNLSGAIKSKIIGQNNAIDSLIACLLHRRFDLGQEDRPLGVFLLCGDSGVGKTATAKALAQELFGNEKSLVHIDLAEYSESGSTYKLIGAPPGLIGHDGEGLLIRGLQKHPSCVLLFDEAEKAEPEVIKLLLGLLDNGRITGSKGKTYDASGCVIILTTNAVTSKDLERKGVGFGYETQKNDIFELLAKTFPREFLGRMDEIIAFADLTKMDMERIIELKLHELKKKLIRKNVDVIYDSDRLTSYLFGELGKLQTGARGIARLLERKLTQPIAAALIDSEEDGIEIELDDDYYISGEITVKEKN